MSAATGSPLGPTDMQEYMILGYKWEFRIGGIFEYGAAMCEEGAKWGIEGFVRMEAGFEILKCDFSDGLDLVSTNLRPQHLRPEGHSERWTFEWLRAIALRYDGIDGSRIQLDFSSMIHAGFYPANLTNPDPKYSHLPRLVSVDPAQLSHIRSDIQEMWLQERSESSVDWQGIVDMIKKRFSDRLQYLVSKLSNEAFLWEVNVLLNTYIDYKTFSLADSIKNCSSHYLRPVKTFTGQDKLIHAAIEEVTTRICTTLFQIRADLLAQYNADAVETIDISKSVKLVRGLNAWLDWSEWRACRPSCAYDQICYITVCPFGNTDLHYNPRCLNSSEVADLMYTDDNYFFNKTVNKVPGGSG